MNKRMSLHFLVAGLVAFSAAAVSQPTWNTQTITSGNVVSPKSIAYDDSSKPIVFYAYANQAYVAKWNGSSWTTRGIGIGYSTAIYHIVCVRKDSLIHCLVMYNYGGYLLKHVQVGLDGNVRNIATIPNAANNELSLCAAQNAYIIMAYANVIRRFNLTTQLWGGNESFDDAGSSSQPDVTTGPDGTIWVAYRDDAGQNLKVARSRPAGGWDTWFVDQPGNVGTYAQIKVDASNIAHVTYYDATNLRLKYAVFNP